MHDTTDEWLITQVDVSLDALKAAAQKYRRLDKPIQQASLEEVSARLGAVMETIQKRKKQHARDMRSLYEWHATVYRDEMEDMRRCKDEYSPHVTKVSLSLAPELCFCLLGCSIHAGNWPTVCA